MAVLTQDAGKVNYKSLANGIIHYEFSLPPVRFAH